MAQKIKFSESVGGAPILVSDTSQPGTLIYTTDFGSDPVHEIWLYVHNTGTEDAELILSTVSEGGPSGGSETLTQTIPFTAGLTLVLPGLPLAGVDGVPSTLSAYSIDSPDILAIYGYVNKLGL